MTVLLVDTYSLFFRAFHALPPMNTSQGQPTNALYGFAVLLVKLLREQKPTGVALARDLPGGTFRHTHYPEYKAGRAKPPGALLSQLDVLPELVEALGFPLFAAPGFEADDILATLAPLHASRGESVLVVSGDRDLLQLVNRTTQMLFVGQRGKPPTRYDAAAVEARFGIGAPHLPSYVALVGDSSDNIPKLKGIGEATASRLIAEHGDIEGLLAALDTIPNLRLRDTLREHAAQLLRNEALVRLRADVPLRDPERLGHFDEAARARTGALFEELEFKSLVPRLAAIQLSGVDAP